jgi:hypothetical protein
MAASATTTTGNGAGKISDIWAAFAAQAARLPAGPAPDANVAAAYALGWAVGEAVTGAMRGTTGHLAQVPGLNGPAGRWKLLVDQITVRCKRLQAHLKDAGSDPDLSAQVTECAGLSLDRQDPADAKALKAKEQAAGDLHADILEVLWSVELPLGQAYLLGYEMEQMCATPAADEKIDVRAWIEPRVAGIHELLTTLASKLPANAAHATGNSLRLWSAWLSAGGPKAPKTAEEAKAAETAKDLLGQGRRWREVLAGEVAAQDRLRLSDYVAAADSVTGKLRETAWQVARRFWVWLLIAFALVGAGVYLIAADTKGTLGVGITSVIAAFGLTWKGIGEFFGRAAAKGEQKLWDAEIDWAIAYRFTILSLPGEGQPRRQRSRALKQRSRDLKRQSGALKWDKATTEHIRRYLQWKDRWPDVGFPQQ